MAENDPTFPKVRELFSAALSAVEYFKVSNLIFNNAQTASTLAHRGVALLFAGDTNTNKLRGRDRYRTAQNIRVQLSHQVRPKDQIASLDEALKDSEALIRSVLEDPTLRRFAEISYVATTRSLTASGDYIVAILTFKAEHNVDLF